MQVRAIEIPLQQRGRLIVEITPNDSLPTTCIIILKHSFLRITNGGVAMPKYEYCNKCINNNDRDRELYCKDCDPNAYTLSYFCQIPDKPTEDKWFLHMCGWLSPNGEFYGCSYTEHDRLADSLAYHLNGGIYPEGVSTVEYLETNGWMRIDAPIGSADDRKALVFSRYDKDYNEIEPAKKQVEYIMDYCAKYNLRYPSTRHEGLYCLP